MPTARAIQHHHSPTTGEWNPLGLQALSVLLRKKPVAGAPFPGGVRDALNALLPGLRQEGVVSNRARLLNAVHFLSNAVQ